MAENYKHLYEQTKKMLTMYQDELIPGFRKKIDAATERADSIEERLKRITRQFEAVLLQIPHWIPVTERLPESEKIVLVSAKSKTFGYRHTLMVAHIGHQEFTTEEYGWHEYEGNTEYDEEKDCFWIPECWYEVNSVEDNGNWIIDDDYDVTHWMPLPEPPKEGEHG